MWVKASGDNLIEVSSGTHIGIGMQSTPDRHTVQIAPVGGSVRDLARDLTHQQAQAVINRLAEAVCALDLAAVAAAAIEGAEPAA